MKPKPKPKKWSGFRLKTPKGVRLKVEPTTNKNVLLPGDAQDFEAFYKPTDYEDKSK